MPGEVSRCPEGDLGAHPLNTGHLDCSCLLVEISAGATPLSRFMHRGFQPYGTRGGEGKLHRDLVTLRELPLKELPRCSPYLRPRGSTVSERLVAYWITSSARARSDGGIAVHVRRSTSPSVRGTRAIGRHSHDLRHQATALAPTERLITARSVRHLRVNNEKS